jgi:hypothetical protein
MTFKTILVAFFFLMAMSFMVIGCILFYKRYSFKLSSFKAIGIVIDNKKKFSKSMEQLFSPTIEFVTEKGEKLSFNNEKFFSKNYPIGMQIEIIYNPKNPAEAFIDSLSNLYGAAFFCFLTGLSVMLITIYFFYKKTN